MSSHLIIEHIGSEEVLREGACDADIAAIEHISDRNRRCEVLAWRAIVRRELGKGVQIGYDEYGAPQVDSSNKYISISHSKGDVAVLFSDTPCAVDIERRDRNFLKVASRYLSDEERVIAEQNDLYAEMWCAKEALYKYHKRGGVDFVRDVRIVEYRPSQNLFIATIFDGAPLEVHLSTSAELTVATIL